ncbi:MAG: 1-acyl-sn-glycerol-3-phosphate acyltransferase [Bacteroidales bacterium]
MTDDNTNKAYKPIDIKQLFREKNPRMARLIPGFIYRYLHKALVLDEINEILRLHGHKKNFEFADAVVGLFNVTVELAGEENLPSGGPFIFVANHPLGGFDGILLIQQIGERYDRKYRVLVNDILLNIKNMDGIFVPINKHGTQAMENVRLIEEIFKSDQHVMTFPSGLVSRRIKGVIKDTEWMKSFVSKAVTHKRDVVPIHITGRCSNFFYNVARLRTFLGIKANLEMFYLPRETFRHKNSHYKITIGKPISYKNFDKRHKPAEWTAQVKEHCYTLADDPNSTFVAK